MTQFEELRRKKWAAKDAENHVPRLDKLTPSAAP